MRHFILVAGIAVAWFSATASEVRAQPPVPGGAGAYYRPPAYSPYLNLLRSGSPALNYYGLVRPEMQFRRSIQNLSNDVSANQQMIGNLGSGTGELPYTGHPTQFMNLGGYFMNNSGSLGGGTAQYGTGTVNMSRPGTGSTPSPPRRR